jgi:FkbM family methyltransferase
MIPAVIKSIVPETYKRDIKEHLGVPSLHWSLMNIKRLGFDPKLALDIGAYQGEWALSFAEVFPSAEVLMVEAQPEKKDKLEGVIKENANLSYHIALLSSEDGKQLFFNENETASHVTNSRGSNTKAVISESLDEIIKRKTLRYPDFLKLDVQGFEIEVLNGGKKCLAIAEFCLLEVTMIDLGNATLVLDVMNFMDSNGFQLYDITQLMRRPFDKALFQSDFLFIKKTSSLIAAKRWD